MEHGARWQDWTSLVAGLYLMCVPKFTSDSSHAPHAWSTFVLGATISLVAVWGFTRPDGRLAQATNAVHCAVQVAAPRLFGCTEYGAATTNAVMVGDITLGLCIRVSPLMPRRTYPHRPRQCGR